MRKKSNSLLAKGAKGVLSDYIMIGLLMFGSSLKYTSVS